MRKAIEPPGEVRADWEIICDLAKRIERKLGITRSAYWDYAHPSEVLTEMGTLVPEYAGITYERIEREGLQWPVPTLDSPGTPFLFADSSRAAGESFTRSSTSRPRNCPMMSIRSSSQRGAC